jgi:formylglycine-generating enzyme required for sulfatase activity
MGPLELEGEEGRVILPFWLRERGPAAQLMLREMGLSRGARWQRAVRSLRRPGRAYLGLGLCLGLLGVGAAMQGVRWRVGVKGVAGAPRVEQVGAPEFPMEKVEDLGGGKWAVSARGQGRVEVPAGAVVRIEWGTEEREECPKLTAKGKDGMEFVRVCGGTFMMGSGEEDKAAFDWEKPRYRVTLGEYWIGKYEVTVGQYGGEGDASLPVNRVDWHQARKFCQDHGYRLPTEEEWEFAARGREGRIYPWGNKFDSKLVVDTLRPVAEKPEGAGPFGAMHQAGNVWEWVEDCYHSDDYTQRLKRTQEGDKKVDKPDMAGNKLTVDTCWYRVLRGGSFIVEPRFLRSAYRFWDLPEGRFVSVGFRCARGVAPSN